MGGLVSNAFERARDVVAREAEGRRKLERDDDGNDDDENDNDHNDRDTGSHQVPDGDAQHLVYAVIGPGVNPLLAVVPGPDGRQADMCYQDSSKGV